MLVCGIAQADRRAVRSNHSLGLANTPPVFLGAVLEDDECHSLHD